MFGAVGGGRSDLHVHAEKGHRYLRMFRGLHRVTQ